MPRSPFLARLALLAALLVVLLPASLRAQETEPIVITLDRLARVYTAEDATFDATEDVTVTPGSAADYDIVISFPGRRSPPRDAGSYPVRVVATTKTAPARSATLNTTLDIARAPLTATADDQARLFGAPNPPFTVTYDGFLGGDTERVLNRRPAATTPARAASPAGLYPIELTGGLDNNYEIVARNPGELTVIAAYPGTYETLFSSFAEPPSGKLTLTLPARGVVFTGRLDLAREGAVIPLSGRMAPNEDLSGATGFAERRLRNGDTYRVELRVDDSGLSAAVFVREAGDTENLVLHDFTPLSRLAVHTRADPFPGPGAHTFIARNPSSNFGFFFPTGSTFATASISTNGTLKLAGRFADGTRLVASARPDDERRYRFFLRPYGSRPESYAAVELPLEAHPVLENRYHVSPAANRSFYWQKAPAARPDRLFPEGFGPLDSQVTLDPWLPPARGRAATASAPEVPAETLATRLRLTTDPTASAFVAIDSGSTGLGLSDGELPVELEFTPANRALPVLLAPPANPRAWKISVNAKTGAFSGSFRLTDPVAVPGSDAARIVTRKVAFQGVLRQPPGAADGFVGSGYFLLNPLPNEDPAPVSSEIRFQNLID